MDCPNITTFTARQWDIELSDEHANHKWLAPEEIINHQLKFVSEDESNQLVALFNQTGRQNLNANNRLRVNNKRQS